MDPSQPQTNIQSFWTTFSKSLHHPPFSSMFFSLLSPLSWSFVSPFLLRKQLDPVHPLIHSPPNPPSQPTNFSIFLWKSQTTSSLAAVPAFHPAQTPHVRIILQGQCFISHLLSLSSTIPFLHDYVLDDSCKLELRMWHDFLSSWNVVSIFYGDHISQPSANGTQFISTLSICEVNIWHLFR